MYRDIRKINFLIHHVYDGAFVTNDTLYYFRISILFCCFRALESIKIVLDVFDIDIRNVWAALADWSGRSSKKSENFFDFEQFHLFSKNRAPHITHRCPHHQHFLVKSALICENRLFSQLKKKSHQQQ